MGRAAALLVIGPASKSLHVRSDERNSTVVSDPSTKAQRANGWPPHGEMADNGTIANYSYSYLALLAVCSNVAIGSQLPPTPRTALANPSEGFVS